MEENEFYCKLCWVDLNEDVELCETCEAKVRKDVQFDIDDAQGKV